MTNIDYAALGQYVREVRTASGIKQGDLAQKVGVHQSWVSSLENGNITTLNLDRLSKIAVVLNISTYKLLVVLGYKPEPHLLSLPQELSAADKETIRRFVDFLSWQQH